MTFVTRRITNTNPHLVTTPAAPLSVAVDVSATAVVPNNPGRTGLIIVNLSKTNNVYLAFGLAAVAASGLTLLPQMGWRMSEYDFNVEAVSAVADNPATIISVQEFTI